MADKAQLKKIEDGTDTAAQVFSDHVFEVAATMELPDELTKQIREVDAALDDLSTMAADYREGAG